MDYYEILGVSQNASPEEIKQAFRKLSREHHPDVNPDKPEAEERFKDISEAYSVLNDEQKRRDYDLRNRRPTGFPFQDDFGAPFIHIFETNFNTPQACTRIEAQVPMSLQELLTGRQGLHLTYDRAVFCQSCLGVGGKLETCPECHGAPPTNFFNRCRICGGRGEVLTAKCTECFGQGVKTEKTDLDVDLPPGMNVSPLVIKGMGNAEFNGLPAGDFIIKPRIALVSNVSVVQGINLRVNIPVDPVLFMTGATLEIKSPLDEEVTVKIPPSTHFGETFTFMGLGLPTVFGSKNPRGILAVSCLPEWDITSLTEENLEHLRKYAASKGYNVAGISAATSESENGGETQCL